MISTMDRLATEGAALSTLLLPDHRSPDLGELSTHCVLRHLGLLVFPDQLSDVADFLRDQGLAVDGPVPSAVVRSRLAVRHGLDRATTPVSTLVGRRPGHPARTLEVLVLPGLPDRDDQDGVAALERSHEAETHVAFEVPPGSLDTVITTLRDRFGMVADSGGHNPPEPAEAGGRSVFSFALRRDGALAPAPGPRRLEIICTEQELDERAAGATGGEQPEARLLELITGHVTTQALSAAAELGLADVLDERPATADDIATAICADPQAVTRLLRYLVGTGVVATDGGLFTGTPLLRLLRRDNPFRELTMLYGGEFFQAWGGFTQAVRTGCSAFGHVFGQEHFEYFRDRAELRTRFDRSMAASTQALTSRLASAYDFSTIRRVVDIGGGDGTLLTTILRLAPEATGVLFDNANVVNSAATAAACDVSSRIALVEGDFFEAVPPDGDTYVLSRILHDWSDDQCALLLERCRAAMRPGTTLLVVERVLCDGPVPSPAQTWDLHMLAITGGRERTRGEYARLLSDSGFALDDLTTIWHGLSLLVAHAE